MYGSGCRIAGMKTIKERRGMEVPGWKAVMEIVAVGFFVAVRGTTSQRYPALRIAVGTILRAGTTTTGSALPGTKLPFVLPPPVGAFADR